MRKTYTNIDDAVKEARGRHHEFKGHYGVNQRSWGVYTVNRIGQCKTPAWTTVQDGNIPIKIAPEDIELIKALSGSGMSDSEVAVKFEVTPRTIWNIRNKYS